MDWVFQLQFYCFHLNSIVRNLLFLLLLFLRAIFFCFNFYRISKMTFDIRIIYIPLFTNKLLLLLFSFFILFILLFLLWELYFYIVIIFLSKLYKFVLLGVVLTHGVYLLLILLFNIISSIILTLSYVTGCARLACIKMFFILKQVFLYWMIHIRNLADPVKQNCLRILGSILMHGVKRI